MFLSRSFEAFHDGVLLDDFSELLDPIPAYDHSVDFALVARMVVSPILAGNIYGGAATVGRVRRVPKRTVWWP